jgi:hypothetical protein
MGKLDVSRHDGERLDDYVSRLEGMSGVEMSAADRAALAVSLAGARTLLRQQQAPKRKRPSDHGDAYRPPSDAGAGPSPALEYCKALCRTLSPENRAQLLRWLQDGMPD